MLPRRNTRLAPHSLPLPRTQTLPAASIADLEVGLGEMLGFLEYWDLIVPEASA